MNSARFTIARRAAGFSILGLFLLQLAGLKPLVGSLSGSVVFQWLRLLDLFSFAESAASARALTGDIFYSALPILIFYLLVGRAFCGWVCPLDFVFRGVGGQFRHGRRVSEYRVNSGGHPEVKNFNNNASWIPASAGMTAIGFLILAAFIQVPFFTVFVSPITNFYRTIYAGFFQARGFPGEISVVGVSAGILGGFLFLEILKPRLWCRSLCPVGKTYGLLNRVSLLHLEIDKGKCSSCGACVEACYQGVKIMPADRKTDGKAIRDSSCIFCGRCVDACGKAKAAKLRFGL